MNLPDDESARRSLQLPSLLRSMMASGTWTHPGADVLRRAVPFISDPLVVLKTHERMLDVSRPFMGSDEVKNKCYAEYRGSRVSRRGFPWVDVEKTLFIMCNELPGDDVGIALDYRYDSIEPCVVGGDWHSRPGRIVYRRIANSFAEFAELLCLRTVRESQLGALSALDFGLERLSVFGWKRRN